MDKEFEESVAHYKEHFDDLEKEIKVIGNGIIMLEKTLSETEEKGNVEQVAMITRALGEERGKLEYLEEIRRVIDVEYYNKPKVSQEDIEMLEKIHDIEETDKAKKETDPTWMDKDIILSNWHTIDFLSKNGFEATNSIRQPLFAYGFLVKLPDIFETRENEIMTFYYKLPKKRFLFRKRGSIAVCIRESKNTRQFENMLKNIGKHIYDEIRLIRVDNSGKYQYTLVFTGLKLEQFDEGYFSYEGMEPKSLYLSFKYRKVEYVTDREDETADKKDNNRKKDDKEESSKSK